MSTDRIMLDSATPSAVIAAVKARKTFLGLHISLAALYLDGRYAATAADWAQLQALGIDARSLVGITVTGTGGEAMKAAAGDEEPGDMTPAGVARWAHAEHQAGHYPVPYRDRADKAAVTAECAKLGLTLGHDYGLWVATLDGTFHDVDANGHVDPSTDLRKEHGVVAIQFLGAAAAGINADVSLVVAPWWRAPAAPKPQPGPGPKPPVPPPAEITYAAVRLKDGVTRLVVSTDGGKTMH
jgi:hypothetical protein